MAKFVEFLQWSDELEIPAVTCWLLSKENLARPDEELLPYYEVLMELFEEIPNASTGHDVGVRFIGSLDLLPADLQAAAKQLEERMPDGDRRVTIALAYGGRQEIVDAVKGEARLSGFLLWQSAYAEYAFVDVYWPAFRYVDFLRSLRDFTRRTRRYGK
jgi:short-chain Z-isoprenyl diphosphate synthase